MSKTNQCQLHCIAMCSQWFAIAALLDSALTGCLHGSPPTACHLPDSAHYSTVACAMHIMNSRFPHTLPNGSGLHTATMMIICLLYSRGIIVFRAQRCIVEAKIKEKRSLVEVCRAILRARYGNTLSSDN